MACAACSVADWLIVHSGRVTPRERKRIGCPTTRRAGQRGLVRKAGSVGMMTVDSVPASDAQVVHTMALPPPLAAWRERKHCYNMDMYPAGYSCYRLPRKLEVSAVLKNAALPLATGRADSAYCATTTKREAITPMYPTATLLRLVTRRHIASCLSAQSYYPSRMDMWILRWMTSGNRNVFIYFHTLVPLYFRMFVDTFVSSFLFTYL